MANQINTRGYGSEDLLKHEREGGYRNVRMQYLIDIAETTAKRAESAIPGRENAELSDVFDEITGSD